MMTTIEKEICEAVFKDCNIITVYEGFSKEGIHIKSYTVEYNGCNYTLTKNDGEWVYFHRNK